MLYNNNPQQTRFNRVKHHDSGPCNQIKTLKNSRNKSSYIKPQWFIFFILNDDRCQPILSNCKTRCRTVTVQTTDALLIDSLIWAQNRAAAAIFFEYQPNESVAFIIHNLSGGLIRVNICNQPQKRKREKV